jgi:hypothetical protein
MSINAVIPIRVLTPSSIESDFYRGKQHNASSTALWIMSIMTEPLYLSLEVLNEHINE